MDGHSESGGSDPMHAQEEAEQDVSAFEAAIDQYLEELRVARRSSPHTVSNYARDLRAIARSAQAREIEDWQSLGADHVRAIIAEQHRDGISGRSLARRLSALRGLYNYLMGQSQCAVNPAQDILAPKDKKALPATLDPDELRIRRRTKVTSLKLKTQWHSAAEDRQCPEGSHNAALFQF